MGNLRRLPWQRAQCTPPPTPLSPGLTYARFTSRAFTSFQLIDLCSSSQSFSSLSQRQRQNRSVRAGLHIEKLARFCVLKSKGWALGKHLGSTQPIRTRVCGVYDYAVGVLPFTNCNNDLSSAFSVLTISLPS